MPARSGASVAQRRAGAGASWAACAACAAWSCCAADCAIAGDADTAAAALMAKAATRVRRGMRDNIWNLRIAGERAAHACGYRAMVRGQGP
ncbi:hypothetical protein GCM10027564_07520 [Luteimonas notoginsengisoli]